MSVMAAILPVSDARDPPARPVQSVTMPMGISSRLVYPQLAQFVWTLSTPRALRLNALPVTPRAQVAKDRPLTALPVQAVPSYRATIVSLYVQEPSTVMQGRMSVLLVTALV